MFTGLIREIAKVGSFDGRKLKLVAKYSPELGDSIAVNGACLSVVEIFSGGFCVELSRESRKNIAVENLKDNVHIEPAMRLNDRLDGHLVSGHIDGIGVVEKIIKDDNGVDFYIRIPDNLMKFMIPKGSVCIDGISLTINEVLKDKIRLTIIPITFKETLLNGYKIARKVNIESDLLARYLYSMFKKDSTLSWDEVERIQNLF